MEGASMEGVVSGKKTKMQKQISSFFGGGQEVEGSAVYRRGNGPIYEEFKDRSSVDIWCWNVNGINSVMTKGIF
jgi:hypothetical protein